MISSAVWQKRGAEFEYFKSDSSMQRSNIQTFKPDPFSAQSCQSLNLSVSILGACSNCPHLTSYSEALSFGLAFLGCTGEYLSILPPILFWLGARLHVVPVCFGLFDYASEVQHFLARLR